MVANGRGVLVGLAPAMAVGWGAEVAAGADVALVAAVAAGPDGAGVAVADEPQATAMTNNIAATNGNRAPDLNNRCLDMYRPPIIIWVHLTKDAAGVAMGLGRLERKKPDLDAPVLNCKPEYFVSCSQSRPSLA